MLRFGDVYVIFTLSEYRALGTKSLCVQQCNAAFIIIIIITICIKELINMVTVAMSRVQVENVNALFTTFRDIPSVLARALKKIFRTGHG